MQAYQMLIQNLHLDTLGFSTFTLHTTCSSSSINSVMGQPESNVPEFLRCIIEIEIPISGKYIWHYFYLIKYICKHPNKGSFKYFIMQFLKLVSKGKNCNTSAHAVEREE